MLHEGLFIYITFKIQDIQIEKYTNIVLCMNPSLLDIKL